MRIMLVITGTTDGYGLRELHEILTKRLVAARRGAGILRAHGNMPDIYQLDLADPDQLSSASGSRLVIVRPDSSADTRHFVVTMVTDSRAFADQLHCDFTAPGTNLKNINAQELGTKLASAAHA
jgi:hypothetical protein